MCPYCRNIQKGLLPPHPKFEFIFGVNGPNHMYTKKCKYQFKSGLRKGTLCNSMCHEDYCNRCKVNIEKKLKTHTVLKNIEFKKSLSLDK